MTGLPQRWGATEAEHRQIFPADTALAGKTVRVTRAVTVEAPAPLVFRWVCQISVAPYSYDLLDNRGRRSPRTLSAGAEQLHVGQHISGMFEVIDLRPGEQVTLGAMPRATRLFGPIALTYAVRRETDTTSRLTGRLAASAVTRPARLRVRLLAWGDLIMMRKQLLTWKQLAERDA